MFRYKKNRNFGLRVLLAHASVGMMVLLCVGSVQALPGVGQYVPGENLGAASNIVPRAIEGAEIEDRPGALLPLEIKLTSHEGLTETLSAHFIDARRALPKILVLGYLECPMLCNIVLNGLVTSLKDNSLKLGKDYQMIFVSINDKDTTDVAKKKRENYLASLATYDKPDWFFYTGEAAEVKKLADAVGFGFKKDERSGEYAHGAGIFIISAKTETDPPTAVLSKTLYGISFKPADIKFALIEASQGKIGSLADRILLSCFHYQPDSHKYGVYVFGVMRAGGALTLLLLALVLSYYWYGEKRRWRT